jgi:predicted Rossmann fold flavoprotein
MKKEGEKFEVVVIGGGPAGMMAAIRAAQAGAGVVLLERNKLGTKLLITGNGRCNISHREKSNKDLARSFGREGDFLLSPLSVFGQEKTEQFFKDNGLKLKVEKENSVFPVSDKAKDVLDLLVSLLKKNNVTVMNNAEVAEIKMEGNRIGKVVLADGKEITGNNYILSVGGKSYPVTGSKGDGFMWSKKMGHDIVIPKPALTPIEIKEQWLKNLQGLSLKGIRISVVQDGKVVLKKDGELVFAHFGLGGPMILDMSRNIGDFLEKGKVKMDIDLMPHLTQEELEKEIQSLVDSNKNKLLENILKEIVPDKMVSYIIYFSGVKSNKKGFDLKREERQKIARVIKKIEVNVVGLLGFDRAMATHGGVSLSEIDSRTMKSKIVDNLYFAGEIINLDGPCGGYNLQMCWTTGYVAGQSAAVVVK